MVISLSWAQSCVWNNLSHHSSVVVQCPGLQEAAHVSEAWVRWGNIWSLYLSVKEKTKQLLILYISYSCYGSLINFPKYLFLQQILLN